MCKDSLWQLWCWSLQTQRSCQEPKLSVSFCPVGATIRVECTCVLYHSSTLFSREITHSRPCSRSWLTHLFRSNFKHTPKRFNSSPRERSWLGNHPLEVGETSNIIHSFDRCRCSVPDLALPLRVKNVFMESTTVWYRYEQSVIWAHRRPVDPKLLYTCTISRTQYITSKPHLHVDPASLSVWPSSETHAVTNKDHSRIEGCWQNLWTTAIVELYILLWYVLYIYGLALPRCRANP